jgi:PAS domain S-box-containing protein
MHGLARERELFDAHGFLESLIAASPSMICRIDPDTLALTYTSPNAQMLLGFSPAELTGVRWPTLLHPDDVAQAEARLVQALGSQDTEIKKEYRLRASDGGFRWFYSLMRAEYDHRGRPLTILWYCHDIGDRRAAEQALVESQEQYHAILRTANDAFIGMDVAGRVVFWNERAEAMFGWPRAEAVGRSIAETIVPAGQRDAHRRGLARYLDDPARAPISRRLEVTALKRDGSEFPVELTIWASGAAERRTFNAFVRDITEERRAQAAERLAKEEAERANRAKSEFLSRMSHDLRTPLNAVLGFAQLLSADALTPNQIECVQQILRGGQHLLGLINEVLDIARIESGRLSLSLEPVGVHEIVAHSVNLVAPLAAQRGISLTMHPLPANAACVLADRQRLSQILLNLLSNAVKYSHPATTVAIRGEQQDGRFRISVIDQGPGIPAEKLKLLFRPFERLGADATGVEGTGLGLTLARGLAEAMGGAVGVISEVDQGSTFWLELAASEEPAARSAGVSAAALSAAHASVPATVLYIEDNLSNVRLMERLLAARPGVQLLHAADGRRGLIAARERRPDIVFLDLHLPDGGGEDVLRELWADAALRGIPVIVLSADATPGQVRRLLASGATAYLTKPLELRKVLDVLDHSLARLAQTGSNRQ